LDLCARVHHKGAVLSNRLSNWSSLKDKNFCDSVLRVAESDGELRLKSESTVVARKCEREEAGEGAHL
jgi:hypothetical protein